MKDKDRDSCGVCGSADGTITRGVRTASGGRVSLCSVCRAIADEALEVAIKKSSCHGPWFITVSGTKLSVTMKEVESGSKNKD